MRWDKQKREDVKIFSWVVGRWGGHSSKAMGGAGSQGRLGHFKFQVQPAIQLLFCCFVVCESGSLWTRDTPEDSTLQDHSRSSQGPPLCPECPVCSSPLPDAALLCISVKKLFFSPPLFKKNCGRQLCGRCTWKASSLTGPEIALVILGSWYINTPALLLLGWDNSEVHALPNFPLSLWD